jgi:hypothetical protein
MGKHGRNSVRAPVVFGLGLLAWCIICCNCGRSQQTITLQQLIETQDRFYRLALALDHITVEGLQKYPAPDWQFVSETDRKKQYANANALLGKQADQAFVKRVNNTMYSSHWDVLRLLASPYSLDKDTIRRLRQGDLQRDPFSASHFFGYASTPTDFILVSVGPDGKPDVLGFEQSTWGRYEIPGANVSTSRDAEKLGRKIVPDTASWGATITLPVDRVYDPTNGLLSTGDVVFHRREGDNYMFSYEADRPIDMLNFIPRDLKKELQRPAASDGRTSSTAGSN